MKMMTCLVIGLLMSGTTGRAMAAPVQWKAADSGNDHWYDIVLDVTADIYFDEAETAAVAMGGYLATPDLPGEADFIYNNLGAPSANGQPLTYWLGAYSEGRSEGYKWEWVTGGTVSAWGGYAYIDWSVGGNWYDYSGPQGLVQVPNNSWTSGAALQDLPFIFPANGYVVEYVNTPSPVPVPAAIFLLGSGIAGLTGARLRWKKKQR